MGKFSSSLCEALFFLEEDPATHTESPLALSLRFQTHRISISSPAVGLSI